MKKLLPLMLMGVALVAAGGTAADKPKTDKECLQGGWAVTSVEVDGQAVRDGPIAEHILPIKLTFKDDTVTNSQKPEDKGQFTLDPEKKPPTLDLVVMSDTNKEAEHFSMIYELHGDVLRLCSYPKGGSERPKEFTSKGGSVIITLKREVKKPEK
jgi:uncharacterized protein (TIGR03067 family)